MTLTKRISLGLLSAIFALTLIGGLCLTVAYADEPQATEQTAPADYYGAQLTDPIQKAFYNALDSLNNDPDIAKNFKSGNASIVVSCDGMESLAMRYTQGDDTLLKAFGAARDCYYYDKADLFYVDFDYVTLGVSLKNGNYIVSIGSGRADTYFREGVTAQNVQTMIDTYNQQMTELVAKVQAKIDWATSNWQAAPDQKDIATFINNIVCEHITYGFCTTADGKDTVNSPFIRTTYGALVVKQCVCEGYARLYKVVCNKFNIPCELIYGAYVYPNGGVEPHMWNATQIDGKWYANDATFNDSLNNDYLLVTGSYIEADHFADPVISSSGYEMGYPQLETITIEMQSGLLDAYYGVTEGTNDILLFVSYMGMNAQTLASQKGLYLAFRIEYEGLGWGPWTSLLAGKDMYPSLYITHKGNYSTLNVGANGKVTKMEIAVFNIVDDYGPVGTSGYRTNYSDNAVKNNLIEQTNSFQNDTFDPYYVAPAYVKDIQFTYKDDNGNDVVGEKFQTKMQTLGHEYSIKVVYTQPLVKKDASQDVTLSYSMKQLDGFRTTDLNTVPENCSLKDFEWNGSDTITFKFTPSPLYQHNKIWYTFSLNNLINVPTGDKQVGVEPNTFGTLWGYTDTYICTKCLGGGRYLLDNVYAQPALVDDSDLSTNGWQYTDDSGVTHKVSESQRSNLALVVTSPTGTVADNIDNNLASAVANSAGAQAEILSSKTYEIDLQICGAIVTIPNGSYLKIKLGYPTGYDYSSMAEGTTFKLFHFKRNPDGSLNYAQPEEIECVFTELGIIALVESFSPYTIVALDKAQDEAHARSVVTQFNGIGGTVTSSVDKPIASLSTGEQVTYTLNPYQGYQIEYALLNGQAVKVENGTIAIKYADLPDSLAANTLSIGYVATAVKTAEASDAQSVNLSLAYVANTVVQNSVEISNSATAQQVATAVSQAEQSVAGNMSGQAQTVASPTLAAAEQQAEVVDRAFVTIKFQNGEAKHEISATVGTPITESIQKEGFVFIGWKLASSQDGAIIDSCPELYQESEGQVVLDKYGQKVRITEITVVPVWGHSISFNSNGGSSVEAIVAQTGAAVSAPQAPTKSGYTFAGWTLNGQAYTFDTMPDENVVLTATWQEQSAGNQTPSGEITPEKPNNTGKIVLIVAIVVLAVGAAAVAIILVKRSKHSK